MFLKTFFLQRYLLDNQAFGASSNIGQPAKELIFPGVENVPNGLDKIYKRSHGSFAPGEKISKGYDWQGMDSDKKVFGVGKGTSMASTIGSSNIAEILQCDDSSARDSFSFQNKVCKRRSAFKR